MAVPLLLILLRKNGPGFCSTGATPPMDIVDRPSGIYDQNIDFMSTLLTNINSQSDKILETMVFHLLPVPIVSISKYKETIAAAYVFFGPSKKFQPRFFLVGICQA